MTSRIIIVRYNPQWPLLYEREKKAILGAIGRHLAAIEHVGSTAVPGLGAKPIIDIMGGLRRLADADACVEPLRAIGYDFVPAALKDLPDDRYFEQWSRGIEVAHLHLTEHGSDFWRDHLLLRDYLRQHPEAAREYERLKRHLAPRHRSAHTYFLAKSDFIQAALARARAEVSPSA